MSSWLVMSLIMTCGDEKRRGLEWNVRLLGLASETAVLDAEHGRGDEGWRASFLFAAPIRVAGVVCWLQHRLRTRLSGPRRGAALRLRDPICKTSMLEQQWELRYLVNMVL
jgi:hypothetical protein